MKEILCVIAICFVAVGLAPQTLETFAIMHRAAVVSARIDRMIANPSPDYDPYPQPNQDKLSIY